MSASITWNCSHLDDESLREACRLEIITPTDQLFEDLKNGLLEMVGLFIPQNEDGTRNQELHPLALGWGPSNAHFKHQQDAFAFVRDNIDCPRWRVLLSCIDRAINGHKL